MPLLPARSPLFALGDRPPRLMLRALPLTILRLTPAPCVRLDPSLRGALQPVPSRREGRQPGRSPPEPAPVMAVGRTPHVFIRFIAPQEVELGRSLFDCGLNRSGSEDRAQAVARHFGRET